MLAEEGERVYPENRCLMCEREFGSNGKLPTLADCAHRHFRVADEPAPREAP